MNREKYSNNEINNRAEELRLLHTCCSVSQKLSVISDRIEEKGSLNNTVALYYSRIEALGRFLLMKADDEQDNNTLYEKYKKESFDDIIKALMKEFPEFFTEPNVKEAIDGIAALKSVRNYLVHEFGFMRVGMVSQVLENAEVVFNALKSIAVTKFS